MQLFKKLSSSFYLPVLLIGAVVYTPYIMGGGFIYDDWSVSGLGIGMKTISEAYANYFPSFSNRPLAPFYYSLLSKFCGNTKAYISVDILLWLSAVLIIASVLRKIFGDLPTFIFSLFADYLRISYKSNSSAQAPEKLYKEKSLITLIVLIFIVFILSSLKDFPSFHFIINPVEFN